MRIPVVAGRAFRNDDGAGRPKVMLINKALARTGVFGEHPIGRTIYAIGPDPWEVVGIVEDVRQSGLEFEPDPQVFVDFRQSPQGVPRYFVARTDAAPGEIVPAIRTVVRRMDPQATVDNVATMEEIVSNSVSRPRLYAALLGVFAGLAVILAVIGIYGVMAYAVAQRTREIGIRMALGAARADVLGLMLRQSLAVIGIGLVIGLGGAAAVTRYLRGMLFGITPLDPTTFVGVSLLFFAVATFATWMPTLRALRIDPLTALRRE
jgi:predicted permease